MPRLAVLAALRLLLLGCLLMAAHQAWMGGRTPIRRFYLVDGSRSVARPLPEQAARTLILNDLPRLSSGTEVGLGLFAEGLKLLRRPAGEPLDPALLDQAVDTAGERSDLAAALVELEAILGREPLDLIVLTDGRVTRPRRLPQDWRLLPVALAPAEPLAAGLVALQAPPPPRPGQASIWRVDLESRSTTPLTLELFFAGERRAWRSLLPFRGRWPCALELPPVSVSGEVELRLSAAGRTLDRLTHLLRLDGPPRWGHLGPGPAASPQGWEAPAQQPDSLAALDLLWLAEPPGPALADELLRRVKGNGLGVIFAGGAALLEAAERQRDPWTELLPLEAAGADRPSEPQAVVFLLDASGSMAPTDEAQPFPDAVRAALGTGTGDDDQLGVVAFAGQVRASWPLAPRSARPDLAAQVAALKPSGGTDPWPALELGLRMLQFAPQARRRLVLISDGRISPAAGREAGLGAALRRAGIEPALFLVGATVPPAAFQELAQATGGLVQALARIGPELDDALRELLRPRERRLIPGPLATVPSPMGLAADLPPFLVQDLWPQRARDRGLVDLRAVGGLPVLARAFRGRGRVAAFAARPVEPDEAARILLGRIFDWVAARGPALELRLEPDGSFVLLTDAAPVQDGELRLEIDGRDAGRLRDLGAGRLAAPLPAWTPPGALLRVVSTPSGAEIASATCSSAGTRELALGVSETGLADLTSLPGALNQGSTLERFAPGPARGPAVSFWCFCALLVWMGELWWARRSA